MVKRNGHIKAFKIDDTKAKTLINKNVKEGGVAIADEHKSYPAT